MVRFAGRNCAHGFCDECAKFSLEAIMNADQVCYVWLCVCCALMCVSVCGCVDVCVCVYLRVCVWFGDRGVNLSFFHPPH